MGKLNKYYFIIWGNKACKIVFNYHSNEKLASRALPILCPRMSHEKKRKKERNWERLEWLTRSKLIVLVCFRTTMVLYAFNSIAPLVVVIEFRFRSSSSSAHMFAPKPDPVRLKSKRVQFLWQLHYFTNINSQPLNSKLGNCFLKSTWKSSQTMKVPMEREGRLHCLKLLLNFFNN